jgi:ABC-type lipoprotein release transport system permease subunit
VGNPNSMTDLEAQGGTLLAQNHFVGAYSAIAILAGASQGTVVIDGKVVDMLLAFEPLKGSVYPPLLEGHAPRAADEIVLASQTLKRLRRRIGQTVTIAGPEERPLTLRIVGRMIAPSVGDLFTNNMGDGGLVYGPAVRKQQAQTPANPDSSVPPTVFTLFAVRYAQGVSHTAASASLQRDFGRTVLTQLPSEDVLNLQSVDRLPTLLAGLVALLGVATVGNTLVASVRQRRRDLAILKTIGFVRCQVAAVVAWQATSVSLVALLVGLPLGVAGGRWAWNVVTPGIGSVSPALVSTVAIAAVVPTALLVANVIAAWPAWVAARVAPALVMRSE